MQTMCPTADSGFSDYASIRTEAMRQLERLAGSAWTDFNPQDPGITILEQCCYALTEFGYRCDFPLSDLLSSEGRDPAASLYSAARILTSRPVTLTDLRKLAVDVRGVRNAWIEPIRAPTPAVYLDREGVSQPDDRHHELILLQKPASASEPIGMKGLYRIWIEANELGVTSGELVRNVERRLHAERPLGMDFAAVDVLKSQSIQVKASIEITADARPDDVYVEILLALARHTSPQVKFRTLAQCLADGRQIDEVFDGPRLEQGFIDNGELAALKRKTSLRISDFIQAIMRVDGVAVVKHLSLKAGAASWQEWWLDIEDGYAPAFDSVASSIVLERQQFALSVDEVSAAERVRQALTATAYRPAPPEELDLMPPIGRDRKLASYYSIQHHFPENYGLGERGLPPEADALRRSQLRQLQAYLLLFDQLLANQYAQLAHVGDLLGFAEQPAQTYFAGEVDDSRLGLDAIWRRSERDDRVARLGRIVEDPAADDATLSLSPDWLRKNRLQDHLLARFAERFVDPWGLRTLGDDIDAPTRLRELARAKQAWLQRYPQLSAARGTGRELTKPGMSDQDDGSGLEQRLRIKLGLSPTQPAERFYLIEHLLLRPLAADADQGSLPLLADARGADPYSLQISLVMPGWSDRTKVPAFRNFVELTLREETPAHLFAYLVWLDEAAMAAFADAHQTWLDSQNVLRQSKSGAGTASDWFRFRDARDRIIDLLGLGHTYPLGDLPVRYTEVVAWGQQGGVTLVGAQPGVNYELLAKNGVPLVPPVVATGDGDDLLLVTPRILGDIDFALRATRPASKLSRDLFAKPQIKVGLDQSLLASIVGAEALDPSDTDPAAARIVGFGMQPKVEVQSSQAGVDYSLQTADSGSPAGFKTISVADVRGDAATVQLQTLPMPEDCDIRVRATKTFDATDRKATQTNLLNVVLPLKVRANPGLEVGVLQALVDFGGGTTLVVKGSQATASYQLLVRDVQDSEFVRSDTGSGIAIAGMNSLWVARPPIPTPGVQPVGTPVAGTGGDVSLALKQLSEDRLVVVRANKSHANPHSGAPIGSAVQLLIAVVVLVRPGAAADFPLHLRRQDGAAAGLGLQKDTTYLVEKGQPGVYYHFRLAGSDQDLGQPVYFHKAGKGVGGLAVEIDFTLAGQLPSPPPEWDCPVDLAPGDKLSIRAVKAQTGLETVFELTVGALLGAG